MLSFMHSYQILTFFGHNYVTLVNWNCSASRYTQNTLVGVRQWRHSKSTCFDVIVMTLRHHFYQSIKLYHVRIKIVHFSPIYLKDLLLAKFLIHCQINILLLLNA